MSGRGLGSLSPEQGLLTLERLCDAGRVQAAVFDIDWARYFAQAPAQRRNPFLAELVGAVDHPRRAAQAGEVRATAAEAGSLRERLERAPPAHRRAALVTFIRERALRALGMDATRPIDSRMPLGELGLDSLLAVELRNNLATAAAMPLPATLLFDYPTVDALATFLQQALGFATASIDGAAVAPPAAAPTTNLVGAIEDMSDDEVDRLLAERLKRTA